MHCICICKAGWGAPILRGRNLFHCTNPPLPLPGWHLKLVHRLKYLANVGKTGLVSCWTPKRTTYNTDPQKTRRKTMQKKQSKIENTKKTSKKSLPPPRHKRGYRQVSGLQNNSEPTTLWWNHCRAVREASCNTWPGFCRRWRGWGWWNLSLKHATQMNMCLSHMQNPKI